MPCSRNAMHSLKPFHSILLLSIFLGFSVIPCPSSSLEIQSMDKGSSLSVEKPNDVLISADGSFAAGFYDVGENANCFAIWFTQSTNKTVVWMANRGQPVNGRRSKLSLQRDGNLILNDAGRSNIWTTNTYSNQSVRLRLLNTGNLVLQSSSDNVFLWQSFDYPTDTLLPGQPLTRNTKLISSRSKYNYSSGFYSLFFDQYNVLRLGFNGTYITSVYWPDPTLDNSETKRATNNSDQIAEFNSLGYFNSSDKLEFLAADYGIAPMRRLTMDYDGNLRLYSLNGKSWLVSWQAKSQLCSIHGLCGPNGLCVYEPETRCSCVPGFKHKDPLDWAQGCDPIFDVSCDPREPKFVRLPNVDFYNYDVNSTKGMTLEDCKNICLQLCTCKGFMYYLDGTGRCHPLIYLYNGRQSPSFRGILHIKLPRDGNVYDAEHIQGLELNCSRVDLAKSYETNKQKNRDSFRYLLWFVSSIGVTELTCIFIGWSYLSKFDKESAAYPASTFRRYTYEQLKKATSNFSEEIGRGGGGVVYKGVLSDNRVTAIKRLEGVYRGEAEFLAEVSIIGRINHMNLIQMWGFCAERKHRLLVYEYMDHGSLAENLISNSLDWQKRFEIALGTARGLAYLHEECLEWVLHCDVKPQNILLDADYQPKVADFGLSKLLNRDGIHDSSFSRIRGTRGYMAPEWILNLPITSKVDVYSYGIVIMEMVTGKSALGFHVVDEIAKREITQLVTWVREKMGGATTNVSRRIEEIIDPNVAQDYDLVKMEALVRVALQCVDEEKDARPTMSQVVEMLLSHERQF